MTEATEMNSEMKQDADEFEDGELPEEGEINDDDEEAAPSQPLPSTIAPAMDYQNTVPPDRKRKYDDQPVEEPYNYGNMTQKKQFLERQQERSLAQVEAALGTHKPKGYRDHDPRESFRQNTTTKTMIDSWMSGAKKTKLTSNDELHDDERMPYGADATAAAEALLTGGMPSVTPQQGDRDERPPVPSRDVDYRQGPPMPTPSTSSSVATVGDYGHALMPSASGGDRDYRHMQQPPRARVLSGSDDGASFAHLPDHMGAGPSPPPQSGSPTNRQYPPPKIFRGGGPPPGRGGKPIEHLLCKFYREGRCRDRDTCSYSHSIGDANRNPELCKFYQQGLCKKNWNCPFLHGEWPCKQWHRDQSCRREHCKFSHAKLDEFSRAILDQIMQRDGERRGIFPPTGDKPGTSSSTNTSADAADTETLPSNRTVLLKTPISQRGEMEVFDFANWLSGGQLEWIGPPPPGLPPPDGSVVTPGPPVAPPTASVSLASVTSAGAPLEPYIPPASTAHAAVGGGVTSMTPSAQGPLLATPSLPPVMPPTTVPAPPPMMLPPNPAMYPPSLPPPPPPSGMPPVPIGLAAIAPGTLPPPPGIMPPTTAPSFPPSVAPGPMGTTYDPAQLGATSPPNTNTQPVVATAPARASVGLLSTVITSGAAAAKAEQDANQAHKQATQIQQESTTSENPPDTQQPKATTTTTTDEQPQAPAHSATFDINEMLRRIREHVKPEAEEPNESPASPPPPAVAPETRSARATQPVTIPSQDMPTYRLVAIDIPPTSVDPALLQQASITDAKLRNDPRIKKLLEGQFNAVTNLISAATTAKPSSTSATTPTTVTDQSTVSASSSSAHSMMSIIQNPVQKPSDPRIARDPRSRAAKTATVSSTGVLDNKQAVPMDIVSAHENTPSPVPSSSSSTHIKSEPSVAPVMKHSPPAPVPPPTTAATLSSTDSSSAAAPQRGWMPSLAVGGEPGGAAGASSVSIAHIPMPNIPLPPDLNGSASGPPPPSSGISFKIEATKDPRLAARHQQQQKDRKQLQNGKRPLGAEPPSLQKQTTRPAAGSGLRQKRADMQFESPLAAANATTESSARYNQMPNVKVVRKQRVTPAE